MYLIVKTDFNFLEVNNKNDQITKKVLGQVNHKDLAQDIIDNFYNSEHFYKGDDGIEYPIFEIVEIPSIFNNTELKQVINFSDKFKNAYKVQACSKIIGVDYDDTITEYRPYPEVAPLNKVAKKYLDKLNEKGFTLVLWTARCGRDYEEVYDRCVNEFGLTYLKKDSSEFVHGTSGKLVANFYIDDHSYVDKKIPWKKIYKYLIKTYC